MRTLVAGQPAVLDDDLLIAGDNLAAMATLPDGAFDMAYLDPPFNTGNEQRRGALAYADAFADYAGFLAPRLERVRELSGLDVGSTDGREKLSRGLKAMRVLGVAAPGGPATEPGTGAGRVPKR